MPTHMTTERPRLSATAVRDELALLTEEEVADALTVTTKTLAIWRSKGFGPRCTKLGKKIFYRVQDLHAWIESQAAAPAPVPTGVYAAYYCSECRYATAGDVGGSTPRCPTCFGPMVKAEPTVEPAA